MKNPLKRIPFDNYQESSHFYTCIHLDRKGNVDRIELQDFTDYVSYHEALNDLSDKLSKNFMEMEPEGWIILESRISHDGNTAEYFTYIPFSGTCIHHDTVYPF